MYSNNFSSFFDMNIDFIIGVFLYKKDTKLFFAGRITFLEEKDITLVMLHQL